MSQPNQAMFPLQGDSAQIEVAVRRLMTKKLPHFCAAVLFGIRGAIRVMTRWVIRRRRKRGERVNRNEQRTEAPPRGRLRRLRLRRRAAEIPLKRPLAFASGFLWNPGSERPENCPVDSFQWRTGGSPGPPANDKMTVAFATVIFGIRRRPTLPGRYQPSTIGTEGLNFCVRYGNRWNPFVIATGNGELIHSRTLTTAQQ